MIDEFYARQNKLHVGDKFICSTGLGMSPASIEPGMLTRVVVPLATLQDLTANTGKVSMVLRETGQPIEDGTGGLTIAERSERLSNLLHGRIHVAILGRAMSRC